MLMFFLILFLNMVGLFIGDSLRMLRSKCGVSQVRNVAKDAPHNSWQLTVIILAIGIVYSFEQCQDYYLL